MKVKYRDIRLSKENKARLDQINSIIREYQRAGYVMTLRQLYYQLVTREVIPNVQKEYAKLSTLLKEGRMGGIVDWNAIEDRLRSAESPSSWDDPGSILDSAINSYAKPRMKGQDNYIEVWVEKDALSGVLSRVTEKYHIPICVNRGYSSASAMHEAYKRFSKAWRAEQQIRILYLGDYDPSGIDMIRDIEDRILEFFFGALSGDNGQEGDMDRKEYLLDNHGVDFEIVPIALTRKQITQYKPPPNPAKMSDPRAAKFVADHGKTSWEVDALPPEVLNQILTKAIVDRIDVDAYDLIVEEEEEDKDKLRELKKSFFGDDG